MGLLDSILGSVLGGGSQAQSSPQAALINAVIQMMLNKGGSGGGGGALGSVLGSALGGGGGNAGGMGGLGGLGGLIGALTQGGLGNVANSWVSRGQNLPISPDQITQILGGGAGDGLLAQLAQQAGMSQGDAASGLSQILPDLVDKLTPDGQVPEQDSLEKMLGSLGIGR